MHKRGLCRHAVSVCLSVIIIIIIIIIIINIFEKRHRQSYRGAVTFIIIIIINLLAQKFVSCVKTNKHIIKIFHLG